MMSRAQQQLQVSLGLLALVVPWAATVQLSGSLTLGLLPLVAAPCQQQQQLLL
jgi:hypothetical protein